MLNPKFPATMAMGGRQKNCQKSLFCIVFSIKTVLKKCLAHVQNFLGDEGDCRFHQTPKKKGAHPPSGNPLMHF
jgi:hypothetical protein